MTALERLGDAVARAAGSVPPAALRERVRRRVTALSPRAARKPGQWLRWSAALTVVAVLLSLGMLASSRAGQLRATTPSGPISEGAWLDAGRGQALPVAFGDRGRIELGRASRARLSTLSLERVVFSLEEGSLSANLRPQSGTTWTVAAGPFRIEVLGTAFEARWTVETKALKVRVQRGVVRVVGGSLDQQGIVLRAGDLLEIDALAGRTLLTQANPALGQPTPTPSTAGQPPLEASVPPPAASAAAPSPATPGSDPQRELRELLRQAKHQQALRLAEDLGFEALVQSLSAADLSLLGNAARFQQQTNRARLALLALRKRFPASSEAGTAVFLLGRLAAEQDRDYRAAARWFATYTQERPSGPMAAEALGRRAQLLSLSGDHAGAKAAAGEYLKRHPNGAYATIARGLSDGRTLRAAP